MGLEKVAARLLEEIRENGGAVSAFANGLESLQSSKVLDLIKILFRPQTVIQADDPQAAMSISGAYAAGASDAIETLIHFKELYLQAIVAPREPRMDFSSLDTNVRNGNLTKEEADAIRSGTKPDYSKYYTTGNVGSKSK